MSAFKTYWSAYGGIANLLLSPYFNFSWISVVCVAPIWYVTLPDHEPKWIGVALSTLPGMFSFSLGGMAIFMAMTKGLFLQVIQDGGEKSLFIKMIAAFFHFLLMQLFTILIAMVWLAYHSNFLSWLGCTLFVYALSCGVAAGAILVDLAEIKNMADPMDNEGNFEDH
jgi:hypothetical protein